MASKSMAKEVEGLEKAPEMEAPVVKAAPVQESVYPASELADSCKVFGASREIVVVALRLAGKETATFSEAKKIIEKFKNKEVK